jgi:hypothetical protein
MGETAAVEFESPHPLAAAGRQPFATGAGGHRPAVPLIGCAGSARSAAGLVAVAARLLPDDLVPGD